MLVQSNIDTGVPVNEIEPLAFSDLVFFIVVLDPRTSKFITNEEEDDE